MDIVKSNNVSEQFSATISKHPEYKAVGVHLGHCTACPVKKSCPDFKEDSTVCQYATNAYQVFLNHVATESDFVKSCDFYGVKSLAALFATLEVTQLYFNQFGSIAVHKGKLGFTDLYKQWSRMNAEFRDSLSSFGLTPVGRKVLSDSADRGVPRVFEDYIDAKYTVTNGVTEEDKHNRLLQRSESVELAIASNPGSYSETDVRVGAEPRSEGSLEVDGGGSAESTLEARRYPKKPRRERVSRVSANFGRAEWEDDDSRRDSFL